MTSSMQPESPGGMLPEGFAELEPFVERWALKTETDRTARRHNTDIATIKTFYTAMLGRLDDALEALNRVSQEKFTEEQKRLHYLTLSLCEISPAVEIYGQPEVVDGFERARFPRVDIPNMTPSES